MPKDNDTVISWQWKIQFYEAVFNALPPVLLAFGLLSNAGAFLVLLRPRLRAMVVHLPLLVLSVADSVVLLSGLLRHWLRKATYFTDLGNLDPQAVSDASCKVLELLLYLSLMFSSWLVTLISVERFLTVCITPHSRLRAFFTSRQGLLLTMGIGLCCLLALNLHFFVTRGLAVADGAANQSAPICRNLPNHVHFVESIFPKLDLTFTAFIPFVVIAACNMQIVYKLRDVRKKSGLSSSQSAVAGYRTTVMLLLTTFVFIGLTSPAKVYLTVIGGTQPQGLNPATDPEAFYSHRVLWSVLLVLQFSNHCCNFLLYCASNPQFRSEAWACFCRCTCCCCCRASDGAEWRNTRDENHQQQQLQQQQPGERADADSNQQSLGDNDGDKNAESEDAAMQVLEQEKYMSIGRMRGLSTVPLTT